MVLSFRVSSLRAYPFYNWPRNFKKIWIVNCMDRLRFILLALILLHGLNDKKPLYFLVIEKIFIFSVTLTVFF
jgi:hypothetical protein